MKMYILVRDSVPLGFAVVGVAHASLAAYLKFRDTDEIARWLAGPFHKAVCRVSDADFEKAKQAGDFVSITESALAGSETVLAFKPRDEWPKGFRFFQLFRE